MNILFVTEKWCDGNPNLSWTNSFHNIFNTFEKYKQNEVYDTIHLDEAYVTYGTHIDTVLLNYVQQFQPNVIFVSFLGNSHLNPSNNCLQQLKKFGCKLCVLWPDTSPGFVLDRMLQMDFVDLHISIDHPFPSQNYEYLYKNLESINHIYTWTPEDKSLYYPEEKSIDFSILCSLDGYLDRIEFVNYLQTKNINLLISGGQRRDRLSSETYARILRHTRATINFPLSQTRLFYQAKGRIFESAACKTVFFDYSNPSTDFYFDKDTEYISYNSLDDFYDKYKYYMYNVDELTKIANNCFEKYQHNYTSNHWWSNIFKKLQ